MTSKSKPRGFVTYQTYLFKDKDPIIDELRTLRDDRDISYANLQAISGVSATTYHNWWNGKTRRPQFATVKATLIALGYDFQIVDKRKRQHLKVVKG